MAFSGTKFSSRFQELGDDLDDYMEALSKTGKGATDAKENISKLKQKLAALKQDLGPML
jgi:hypothetical protein